MVQLSSELVTFVSNPYLLVMYLLISSFYSVSNL